MAHDHPSNSDLAPRAGCRARRCSQQRPRWRNSPLHLRTGHGGGSCRHRLTTQACGWQIFTGARVTCQALTVESPGVIFAPTGVMRARYRTQRRRSAAQPIDLAPEHQPVLPQICLGVADRSRNGSVVVGRMQAKASARYEQAPRLSATLLLAAETEHVDANGCSGPASFGRVYDRVAPERDRTPPHPDAGSQIGRAAGTGGVALGALVALVVAAVFLVLAGAHRSSWRGRSVLRMTDRSKPSSKHWTRFTITSQSLNAPRKDFDCSTRSSLRSFLPNSPYLGTKYALDAPSVVGRRQIAFKTHRQWSDWAST